MTPRVALFSQNGNANSLSRCLISFTMIMSLCQSSNHSSQSSQAAAPNFMSAISKVSHSMFLLISALENPGISTPCYACHAMQPKSPSHSVQLEFPNSYPQPMLVFEFPIQSSKHLNPVDSKPSSSEQLPALLDLVPFAFPPNPPLSLNGAC